MSRFYIYVIAAVVVIPIGIYAAYCAWQEYGNGTGARY